MPDPKPRLSTAAALLVLISAPSGALSQSFTKITDASNPIVTDVSIEYAGAAWIDYDGDGHLDLFVNNGFLYRGDGTGAFTKVTTAIGTGIFPATGRGNCWADYDDDGDLDVYIASGSSVLYDNDGTGTFTAVSTGDIGQTIANRGWSCAWADWSGDGALDLAITHPAGFVPGAALTNHLFRSSGPPDYDLVRVTDTAITDDMTSFTVGTWSDYDADGDMDYFIGAGPANGTTQPDYLYRNRLVETGTADFERIVEAPIGTDSQDGQIWNWIDYDNDGDLDAYLTNWGQSFGGLANRLYRNDAESGFTAITSSEIVTDVQISLGSVWGDFDNDGDLDVVVTNDNSNEDKYYRNDGDGTFTSVDNVVTESVTHRGGSAGDYDADGDLDLYLDGPFGNRSLFRNDTANGNGWLMLALEGVDSNRTAIGAKVRVEATIGGGATTQMREVSSQNTFNGHNALDVHFGLGDATVADAVIVEWPSGIVQRRASVAADQKLAISEVVTTPAVPDSRWVAGTPMRASRNGTDVDVTWDAAGCGAPVAIQVYHGNLGAFDVFAGGACGLVPTGTATVAIPDDTWFVVATADGDADGSYGRDSEGNERVVGGAPSACPGIVQHATLPACP